MVHTLQLLCILWTCCLQPISIVQWRIINPSSHRRQHKQTLMRSRWVSDADPCLITLSGRCKSRNTADSDSPILNSCVRRFVDLIILQRLQMREHDALLERLKARRSRIVTLVTQRWEVCTLKEGNNTSLSRVHARSVSQTVTLLSSSFVYSERRQQHWFISVHASLVTHDAYVGSLHSERRQQHCLIKVLFLNI